MSNELKQPNKSPIDSSGVIGGETMMIARGSAEKTALSQSLGHKQNK